MSADPLPRLDRRHRRRAETIEQIVDVAIDVMAEQGAAGLSLGEVARRVGVRPPSLYVYFASKNDVYDAVFARGWRQLNDAFRTLADPDEVEDLAAYLLTSAELFVRWNLEHQVQAQLMVWRPVPGYEPSPAAYAPALESLSLARTALGRLQERGLLRDDVELEHMLRAWTALTSGVLTQQLANAPQQPFEQGDFTALLPEVVSMFLAQYAPPTERAPQRRGRHGDARRPGR